MRRAAFLFFVAALPAISWEARAAVVYVKAGAAGANNGLSWAGAFGDLQTALAAAQPYDAVWVAAGSYKPTSGSDRTISFLMPPNVSIYGGFAGIETALDQRNWTANPTILSGDIGAADNAADNSFHLVQSGTLGLRLDGFTITGGNANGAGAAADGGGMLNDPRSAPLTVANCSFIANSCSRHGGAMRNEGLALAEAGPTLINCSFTNNSALDHDSEGGAVYNNIAMISMTDCVFENNTDNGLNSGGEGGAASLSGPAMLRRCIFKGNSAGGGGGAIVSFTRSLDVVEATDCRFEDNFVPNGFGGAVELDGGMTDIPVKLSNCIFVNNGATGKGGCGGAVATNGSRSSFVNCIFAGNFASGYFISNLGGGAIANGLGVGARLDLTNCTFFGNSTSSEGAHNESGGALLNRYSSQATISNCIFWGDLAPLKPEISGAGSTIRNCIIQGSFVNGLWNASLGANNGGNLDQDPRFFDAAHIAGPDGILPSIDDGLRPRFYSPGVDAGWSPGAPAADILGDERYHGPDIGAYEVLALDFPEAAQDWALYR